MIARIATLAAAAAVFGAAQAQTKWDMPTPYSEGEFHTRNVKAFAEDVNKATGGKLDISVHSNGTLITGVASANAPGDPDNVYIYISGTSNPVRRAHCMVTHSLAHRSG